MIYPISNKHPFNLLIGVKNSALWAGRWISNHLPSGLALRISAVGVAILGIAYFAITHIKKTRIKQDLVRQDSVKQDSVKQDPMEKLPRDVLNIILQEIPAHYHLCLLSKTWCEFIKNKESPTLLCEEAAKAGHFSLLKWAHEIKAPISSQACINAAAGGHLDIIKWLKSIGKLNNQIILRDCTNFAVQNGHLQVAQWLEGTVSGDSHKAAENGHFERFKRHDQVLRAVYAANRGQLEVLKWLISSMGRGCAILHLDEFAASAIKGGHVKVLEWLLENGASLNLSDRRRYTIESARNGHLEMLKWLIKSGAGMDEEEYALQAVKGGQVKVLEWVIETGFSLYWNKTWLLVNAAENGHVELLKWHLKNGASLQDLDKNKYALEAAEKGYLELLKWLMDNGATLDKKEYALGAAKGGQIEVLKWLKRTGLTIGEEVCTVARDHKQNTLLKWAIENGPIRRVMKHPSHPSHPV